MRQPTRTLLWLSTKSSCGGGQGWTRRFGCLTFQVGRRRRSKASGFESWFSTGTVRGLSVLQQLGAVRRPPACPAGSLTDVAAFHPRSRGRSSSRVASSRSSDSSGRRRSSLGARLDRRMAPPAVPGAADGSRGRGLGQTLELDMNVPYLLNTYLGRQLPQGGKAAAVRAAAAHTGRPESGRTPR